MQVNSESFGTFKNLDSGGKEPVTRYILTTSKGVIVKLISFGASINSVEVPDKNNQLDHVVLGFESVEDYLQFPYVGNTIGRVANRIKSGKFAIEGKSHQLTVNNQENHLHGGKHGWDKHNWKSFTDGQKVVFSLLSPNGEQGYPGDVMAQVTYTLNDDGGLQVDFQALVTEATPINMTNHAFFNLAGHAAGQSGLFEHTFQVLADTYLPVHSDSIPTGEILPVEETPFDLTKATKLSEALAVAPSNGLDHCFCVRGHRGVLRPAAVVCHPPSGRKLEVWTTEAGVQIYTGNFLPKAGGQMVGRGGVSYTHQGAFCCEPQNYPNAVNQGNFPSSVTRPGQLYQHSLIYKFALE